MSRTDSIESIVHEYSQRLFSFIKAQVNSDEDARDILQDVFCQLITLDNDDSRDGIEQISAWLYRVSRNAVLNFWRKKKEIPFSSSGYDDDEICRDISSALFCSPPDSPENIYLRKLVWQELENALSELPPEQSDVFCLTVFDGIPIKEISAATGISSATLLSRKHYAVKHLRLRLHDLYSSLLSHK